jgi:hypothetical protein
MTVLKTPEGKKVVINSNDPRIYQAPRNPPNTGTRYTSGTDIFSHKARSGTVYFYTHTWSMWQGTEDEYRLVSPDEVKDLLVELAGMTGHDRLTDAEIQIAEEHFPGIFDEDA